MKAGEIIKFNSGLIALAVTLKTDDSDIVNFGNIDSRIGAKGIVRSTGKIASVWVEDEFFRRVFNTTCELIDGGPSITGIGVRLLIEVTPNVTVYKLDYDALQTDIFAVDTNVLISKWQRELVKQLLLLSSFWMPESKLMKIIQQQRCIIFILQLIK